MLLKDTGLQKTVLTDVDGKYIFEDMTAGSYTLKASAVGFAAYTSPPLVLQTPTTLPDIVLQEQKGELEEVTIRAQKPFIEVKADKIVRHMWKIVSSAQVLR